MMPVCGIVDTPEKIVRESLPAEDERVSAALVSKVFVKVSTIVRAKTIPTRGAKYLAGNILKSSRTHLPIAFLNLNKGARLPSKIAERVKKS